MAASRLPHGPHDQHLGYQAGDGSGQPVIVTRHIVIAGGKVFIFDTFCALRNGSASR